MPGRKQEDGPRLPWAGDEVNGLLRAGDWG